ncbi:MULTISPECIES: twin-arginine translocase TatA/TatE family subunit [Pseudomonas]|jgi:sec-independent protein translocase protein TatA|uniref:Sec-independent protein translocase protein TatA n=1 Tax=Pseudomonas frederiksbergensis TaxID=104087 RepID=A0A423K266_9PSED|nr:MULTISPECIES: twin-arginine translocase TatA/TatE family subunit [Pseudomonas]MBK5414959.1 twin-arginine translocase TatA/TatE family subunit [Pseudomonas sp. TH31]MBK5509852.1 twin-arginine translocase TatA/TatE family subunit [Pseudomonas sp. TH15]MBK5553066.1 twin-arginine translocase TatA/TatE family subunit [Pseudomonas sp. TH03]MEB0227781.1 twin-arginine translocase TatA/TatE family subunit [Pseudomonas sp. 5S1]MEB0296516.1 twin-arginine translocase TatA/TatE family subunit [Pseudomon
MGIFDWKHWIVILVVVVLVFGTKKLKNLGTDVGESIKGFRKAMNDEEKPVDPTVTPAQPVPPAQPTTTSPLNQPHTIDVQAQKVEEPIRKDV